MDKEVWLEQVTNNPEIPVSTSGGYSYEQVMWSRNTSKDPKYWFKIQGKDKFLFRSAVAESWEFLLPDIENPIRNMQQVYLYFKDSTIFTEPQRSFTKSGKYTHAKQETPLYESYWDEQEARCYKGYEEEGVRISGRHYFMLNFARMKAQYKKSDGTMSSRKIETFPSFVDFQYYLLNEIEWWYTDDLYGFYKLYSEWFPLATEKDHESITKQIGAIPKARRKGLTYLNAGAINSYNFVHLPNSYNIIGAYQESFYGVLLNQGVKATLNWITEHTPWQRRRDVLNKHDNFKASYKVKNDFGDLVEKGFKSEIQCISFHSTAFAGIGNSADSITIEEAGKFNNLLDVWGISIEPLVKDGDTMIGSGVIFGTSGELDAAGGSQAIYHISYHPEALGLAAYENIYEDAIIGDKTSLFIDTLWFYPTRVKKTDVLNSTHVDVGEDYLDLFEGDYAEGVDDMGNSHRAVALVSIQSTREARKKAGGKIYNNFITQYPLYLSEAFLVSDTTPFDKALVREAKAHLVTQKPSYEIGYFTESREGDIKWIMDRSRQPIMQYPNESDEEEGCWVLFENPDRSESALNMPNRYIAGMDPIDNGYEEASSDNKHSLASTYILDTLTGNLVATYTGRPARARIYYKNVVRGLRFYKAQVLYENNLKGFMQYCITNKAVSVLANEPTILNNKPGYKMGKVNTKGFHATPAVNHMLLELLANWLEQEVLIGQDPITGENQYTKRYFMIPDMGLLDELEKYSSKGNFDRISGMGALMLFYEQTSNSRQYFREIASQQEDEGWLFKKFRQKYM